jgi:hypothetical protein
MKVLMTGTVCDQKTSRFSVPVGRIHGWTCGCKCSLLKVRKGKLDADGSVYNPSYSGSRDQEDCGSKPARANSSKRPYLEKNPSQKIGLVEWLKVKALSSSPVLPKKKKKS